MNQPIVPPISRQIDACHLGHRQQRQDERDRAPRPEHDLAAPFDQLRREFGRARHRGHRIDPSPACHPSRVLLDVGTVLVGIGLAIVGFVVVIVVCAVILALLGQDPAELRGQDRRRAAGEGRDGRGAPRLGRQRRRRRHSGLTRGLRTGLPTV